MNSQFLRKTIQRLGGGTNYNDQDGYVNIGIAKADADVSVSGYSGAYDAGSHGATGSVTGVDADGAALGGSLDLGESFTDAPGGSAHWVCSGGTNYNKEEGERHDDALWSVQELDQL